MKYLSTLILLLGVFLLTGCQKDDEATGGDTVSFKKVGDPRNPADFMSREEIKVIEDAFLGILARKKDDPDSQIKDYLYGGKAGTLGDSIYLLEGMEHPIASMEGDSLYVSVIILYNVYNQTFSVGVSKCIGNSEYYESSYYSADNTDIYLWDSAVKDRLIMFVDNCSFLMELKNTPGHKEAKVSFPVRMVWDEGLSCELLLDAKDIRVEYLD